MAFQRINENTNPEPKELSHVKLPNTQAPAPKMSRSEHMAKAFSENGHGPFAGGSNYWEPKI